MATSQLSAGVPSGYPHADEAAYVTLPGRSDVEVPSWSRVEGSLMSAARAVRRAYDAALSELELNLSEASVLAHLGHAGSLTQVELARLIGTGRSRVGAYVDSLEQRGAVRREASRHDRRVWLVSLTESGRDLWRNSVAVDRSLRRVLRAGTNADERALLDTMLRRLLANADAFLERGNGTVSSSSGGRARSGRDS